jgi:hypothetical protein
MSREGGKGPVSIVSACMRADGLPDFALTEVEVTPAEYDDGVHYGLADEALAARGYDEPYVHFAEPEAPAFLLPAVRQYLGLHERDTVPAGGAGHPTCP